MAGAAINNVQQVLDEFAGRCRLGRLKLDPEKELRFKLAEEEVITLQLNLPLDQLILSYCLPLDVYNRELVIQALRMSASSKFASLAIEAAVVNDELLLCLPLKASRLDNAIFEQALQYLLQAGRKLRDQV